MQGSEKSSAAFFNEGEKDQKSVVRRIAPPH